MDELRSLADQGVKRQTRPPVPDIETFKTHRPQSVAAVAMLGHRMGHSAGWLFADGAIPDFICGAYRDKALDPEVSNSPHHWDAWDLVVGPHALTSAELIERQAEWIRQALAGGYFTRGGLYVGQNTCHVDPMTKAWMERFHGTAFWVKANGKYTGFSVFTEALDFARTLAKG